MKKVKFTLGLMLAMLFIGANISYAAADLEPERPDKPYAHELNDDNLGGYTIPVGVFIDASSSYANTQSLTAFTTNDAIKVGIIETASDGTVSSSGDYSLGGGEDLRLVAGYYDGATSYTSGYYMFEELNDFLHDYTKIEEYAKINLSFHKGKEVMPFLKRTILTGVWMYNPDSAKNYWVANGFVIEDMLVPETTVDKTMFTDESGVATYTYKQDLTALFRKYPIHSMYYEIWTNDEISTPYVNSYGEGNAYPQTNRPLYIDAAAGIKTSVESGVMIESGMDYSFEVTGAAGKNIVITTDCEYWTVANGGVVITPISDGKWKVTLKKIRVTLKLGIAYEAESESAAGDDGQTGNGSFSEDKVWGSGGTLYVKSAGEGALSIYSVTGQLSKSIIVNGDYTTSMPKGLYIVKLKGKAYKVIL